MAVTEERIRRFQALMKSDHIDASMIRTVSSFTYFTDVMWLRPGLIIPAEGDPIAFIPTRCMELVSITLSLVVWN
jgi:Xaa-Pro aminopeptidase